MKRFPASLSRDWVDSHDNQWWLVSSLLRGGVWRAVVQAERHRGTLGTGVSADREAAERHALREANVSGIRWILAQHPQVSAECWWHGQHRIIRASGGGYYSWWAGTVRTLREMREALQRLSPR